MVRWGVVECPDFGRAEGRTGRRFGRDSGGRGKDSRGESA